MIVNPIWTLATAAPKRHSAICQLLAGASCSVSCSAASPREKDTRRLSRLPHLTLQRRRLVVHLRSGNICVSPLNKPVKIMQSENEA
jgi:hypothetical protein